MIEESRAQAQPGLLSAVQARNMFVGSPPRLLYQMVELAIYVIWPICVSLIFLTLGFSLWFALACGLLAFSWPLIKARYGFFLASRLGKNKDNPRINVRSSSFWFDGFMIFGSPVLSEIRKYSALSRSLDVIYNYTGKFGIEPKEFRRGWWRFVSPFGWMNYVIKSWTDFWLEMPIARDVQSRLGMVSNRLEKKFQEIYEKRQVENDPRPIMAVVLAGGTNQDVFMAVRSVMKKYPDAEFRIVCVEPDGFGNERSKELLTELGIPSRFFKLISEKTSTGKSGGSLKDILEKHGYSFVEFDVVICIGLGDYYFGDRLEKFLRMINNGQSIITANISGNWVERMMLHTFIQWPKMQYLPRKKYLKKLQGVFGGRISEVISTPFDIFNIALINW